MCSRGYGYAYDRFREGHGCVVGAVVMHMIGSVRARGRARVRMRMGVRVGVIRREA